MDETDCATQLQAARAEVEALRKALLKMGRMLPGVLLDDRVSSEFLTQVPGELRAFITAAEARAAQAAQALREEERTLRDISVKLSDAGCPAMTILEGVSWVIAAKEQAEQALADCQRGLRLQQPTIELPDKHPLRIRAEQAESALTTLRADHARAVEALREVKQLITDLPDAANDSAVAIGERRHFEYVAASIIDTALGVQS